MKKRFIKIFRKEKEVYKMINQTEKGFVLIIIDNQVFQQFMRLLNSFATEDEIFVAWQWKHKHDSYTLYRKCEFGDPIQNYNTKKGSTESFLQGMRFNVSCKDTQYFSYTKENRNVPFKKDHKFKSGLLLDRMLKIAELENPLAE